MAAKPSKTAPKTPGGYSETKVKQDALIEGATRRKPEIKGPKVSGTVSDHPNSPVRRGY